MFLVPSFILGPFSYFPHPEVPSGGPPAEGLEGRAAPIAAGQPTSIGRLSSIAHSDIEAS
jgi:hypothetical protein